MVEGAEKMKDKIIRIFTCKNGKDKKQNEKGFLELFKIISVKMNLKL